jgi:hypothetical protein
LLTIYHTFDREILHFQSYHHCLDQILSFYSSQQQQQANTCGQIYDFPSLLFESDLDLDSLYCYDIYNHALLVTQILCQDLSIVRHLENCKRLIVPTVFPDLRLAQNTFKASTKDLANRKQILREKLKEQLPDTGTFRTGNRVVSTLLRSSYKGITEPMIRRAIDTEFASNNVTHLFDATEACDRILARVAEQRKGPVRKHVIVSKNTKNKVSETPLETRALLEEYGRLLHEFHEKKTAFTSDISSLKSSIKSKETSVMEYLVLNGGGRRAPRISIRANNGYVEKWKLKLQSRRVPITAVSLKSALTEVAGGAYPDEWADLVMTILNGHRKESVKLTNPRLLRDF